MQLSSTIPETIISFVFNFNLVQIRHLLQDKYSAVQQPHNNSLFNEKIQIKMAVSKV